MKICQYNHYKTIVNHTYEKEYNYVIEEEYNKASSSIDIYLKIFYKVII